MNRILRGAALLVWTAAAACSASHPPAPVSSEQRDLYTIPAETRVQDASVRSEVERTLERALIALKIGDYGRARADLEALSPLCPGTNVGFRVALTGIALELDPRNPTGDPAVARRLAERYLEAPSKPAWTEPALETLYLLALDLGGLRPDSVPPPSPAAATTLASASAECRGAEAGAAVGPLLPPRLPYRPMAVRLQQAELERDSLIQMVGRLSEEMQELRRELARVRETVKP